MFFSINFDGGFAITSEVGQVYEVVKRFTNVKISNFPDIVEAYFNACNEHVQREWRKNPMQKNYLPKLEDLQKNPVFCSPHYVFSNVAYRIFAAVSLEYVAICDNVQIVFEFIQEAPTMQENPKIEIYEVGNVDEAQKFIHWKFYQKILPYGAYIAEPIPFYSAIPINKLVQVKFKKWWNENILQSQNEIIEALPLPTAF